MATLVEWERSMLDRYVAQMATVGDGGPFPAISAFLQTATTEDALHAVERNPELVSDAGEAAFSLLVGFAQMSGFVVLLPALQKRQAWLRDLRKAGWGAAPGT
jgi:hypothetical protein